MVYSFNLDVVEEMVFDSRHALPSDSSRRKSNDLLLSIRTSRQGKDLRHHPAGGIFMTKPSKCSEFARLSGSASNGTRFGGANSAAVPIELLPARAGEIANADEHVESVFPMPRPTDLREQETKPHPRPDSRTCDRLTGVFGFPHGR